MWAKIGSLLQALGYITLSFSVCVDAAKKFINFPKWEDKPLEIRFFLRLIGVTDNEKYLSLFEGKKLPMMENFNTKKRILIDFPLIALLLIFIGFILTFVK